MRKEYFIVVLTLFLAAGVFGQGRDQKDPGTNKQPTLCEIEANPNDYLGKEIDVDAVRVAGFERGWLEDLNPCGTLDKHRFRILDRFDYARRTAPSELRRMNKLLERDTAEVRRIEGRFTVVLSKYEPKYEGDVRYEYQMTLVKIISVSRKISAP